MRNDLVDLPEPVGAFTVIKFIIVAIATLFHGQYVALILLGGLVDYKSHLYFQFSHSYRFYHTIVTVSNNARSISQLITFIPIIVIVIFNGQHFPKDSQVDTNEDYEYKGNLIENWFIASFVICLSLGNCMFLLISFPKSHL